MTPRSMPSWPHSAPQTDGHEAEQAHLLDELDDQFARLAVLNPAACSQPTDYPGWTPPVGHQKP